MDSSRCQRSNAEPTAEKVVRRPRRHVPSIEAPKTDEHDDRHDQGGLSQDTSPS